MFTEKENEISVMEKSPVNAEKTWGGDESEWKNWDGAERDLDTAKFNNLQMQEMVSERTKAAYEQVYGTSVKEISHDLLAQFFIDNDGPRYFRRRFLYRFNDTTGFDKEKIKKYYKGKLWETETKEHA
jgi:hypothetical protein